MVYTGDLKSPVERHAGSSPAPGTINCIVLEKVSVHLANAQIQGQLCPIGI